MKRFCTAAVSVLAFMCFSSLFAAGEERTLTDAQVRAYLDGTVQYDPDTLSDDSVVNILFAADSRGLGKLEDVLFNVFSEMDVSKAVRIYFRSDVHRAFADGVIAEGMTSVFAHSVERQPSALFWMEDRPEVEFDYYLDPHRDEAEFYCYEFGSLDKDLPMLNYLRDTGRNALSTNNIYTAYRCKRYLVYMMMAHLAYSRNAAAYCGDYDREKLYTPSLWRYGQWALYDNDPRTTCVIDVSNFTFTIKEGSTVRIFNGNGKSRDLYFANARIKELSWQFIHIPIKDVYGWQEVTFPGDPRSTAYVDFKVSAVYPGTDYRDVCVSEIDEGWTFPAVYGETNRTDFSRYIYREVLPRLRLDSNRPAAGAGSGQ